MSEKETARGKPEKVYTEIEQRLENAFHKPIYTSSREKEQERLQEILKGSRHELAIKETLNFSIQLMSVACNLFGLLSHEPCKQSQLERTQYKKDHMKHD